MDKLGIYIATPKSTPKLSHPCCACIIAKGPHLARHPNVSTENLDPGTSFHLDFRFFNKVSCQNKYHIPPQYWCYHHPPLCISHQIKAFTTTTNQDLHSALTIPWIQELHLMGWWRCRTRHISRLHATMRWPWIYCWNHLKIWLFNKLKSITSPPNHE